MHRRWYLVVPCLILAGTGIAFIAHSAFAGSKVRVGRPCTVEDRPALAEVDHSAWDGLLQKYVNQEAKVAYATWKANPQDLQALDDYLARMGCVDLSKPTPKSHQLAYWINVYNALTIKGILREYPTSSIRNHASRLGGYNIWKDLLLWVDGRHYSLDDVEHAILRKMGEPRIHFAVVCASIGCPPLANRAFTADNLDAWLTYNGRRFFAQPTNFRVDARSRTVYISSLIQWYGKDFAPSPEAQVRALRPYFPNAQSLTWMDEGRLNVRYLSYDWQLNEQNPPAR